jgi:hypothetical protein
MRSLRGRERSAAKQKSQRIGAGERFSELFNVAASCFKSPRVRFCPALPFYSSDGLSGRQPDAGPLPLRIWPLTPRILAPGPKMNGRTVQRVSRKQPRTRADKSGEVVSGATHPRTTSPDFLGTAARAGAIMRIDVLGANNKKKKLWRYRARAPLRSIRIIRQIR